MVDPLTWGAVVQTIMILCWEGPNSFRALEPGSLVWKARRTTIVLTRRHDRQMTKLIPKAAWRILHVHTDGWPMNTREHRKQSLIDSRSKKLISELLALTIGVVRKWWKMTMMTAVRATPNRVRATEMIPMESLKDRNSSIPATHFTFFASDQ